MVFLITAEPYLLLIPVQSHVILHGDAKKGGETRMPHDMTNE